MSNWLSGHFGPTEPPTRPNVGMPTVWSESGEPVITPAEGDRSVVGLVEKRILAYVINSRLWVDVMYDVKMPGLVVPGIPENEGDGQVSVSVYSARFETLGPDRSSLSSPVVRSALSSADEAAPWNNASIAWAVFFDLASVGLASDREDFLWVGRYLPRLREAILEHEDLRNARLSLAVLGS